MNIYTCMYIYVCLYIYFVNIVRSCKYIWQKPCNLTYVLLYIQVNIYNMHRYTSIYVLCHSWNKHLFLGSIIIHVYFAWNLLILSNRWIYSYYLLLFFNLFCIRFIKLTFFYFFSTDWTLVFCVWIVWLWLKSLRYLFWCLYK